MKVIIAGSRTITDAYLVRKAVEDSGFTVTEVVCGLARGADQLGRLYAQRNKIPVKEFPADWKKFGRAAGVKRNREMALYADALIAVWDGYSRGTKNMIETAKSLGLRVYVHTVAQATTT
jgi:glycerophosphoryl diester phosphodiesterase